ncbi:endopeptidase La [Methanospirillum sp.]
MDLIQKEKLENKNKHYVIPLINTVIYPNIQTKILVDYATGKYLLEEIKKTSEIYPIGLTVQEQLNSSDISKSSLYTTGNLLEIISIHKTDEGYLLSVKAKSRVHIDSITQNDLGFFAEISERRDIVDIYDSEKWSVREEIRNTIHDISMNFTGSEQFTGPIDKMESIESIIGFVLPFLPVSLAEKQNLLEIDSLRTRYLRFLKLLIDCKENIHFRIELTKKVSEKSARINRETMLREQMKAIEEELYEINGAESGDSGYQERINRSSMPDDVKKRANTEVKKLEINGSQSHESPIIRNYLDLLLDLPWVLNEKKSIDIQKTRNILNCNHFGLNKVKNRIIEHLAVLKLKQEKQGSILLLVGPPGTGKTSLGKSIAEALGREYIRISLGGIKDESEIRGHRRTYVGALPGRIIQGIRRAGTKNPVFVLDEIDKLGVSYSGDPASALLEVLDPEQNNSFSDHYLELPYDLSDVFFIATANTTSTIPPPLLDRLEVIEISSYTKQEMFFIGKEHLVPKSLSEHGLHNEKITIEDATLRLIIDKYTHEAGVRGLKKQLDQISRYISEKIVSEKWNLPCKITPDMLHDILGKKIRRHEFAKKIAVPGVATGLAWTPIGGDILFIEATFMPGTGKLTLTGQLGEVMKESANISMSLIRSRFAHTTPHIDFMNRDVHIHVPSGSTPKDGPSAGITLFTALASLITGKPVDTRLALTGEITLSGSVLPVGGIKEKILAAHRAGITKIILPKENSVDLEEIPLDVLQELTFVIVESIDEVLDETLDISLLPPNLSSSMNQSVSAFNLI